MTQPDRAGVDAWLEFVHADLRAIDRLLEEPVEAAAVCFHAQQAAEKVLKAALAFLDNDPPRVHDVVALANLLPSDWLWIHEEFPDLAQLNTWTASSRYPEARRTPSVAQARTAADLARRFVSRIEPELAGDEPNG